ncbi:MAG TPA: WecB/TagA/CpsF family glycosyltransferase, partial [Candidatus Portnoybacteria bacterium]|nr:WecB/TagA/CpsF family glycosyltransferase [Candidatus Portnoybacteria bacterium]
MKINLLDVKVDKITSREVLNRIEEYLQSQNQYYIVTPNPEFLMEAQRDEEFKKILNYADLAIPDGVGLLWAARFLNLPSGSRLKSIWQVIYSGASLVLYPKYCQSVFPERVTGTDLIYALANRLQKTDYSIFLLGAKGQVAKMASQKLKQKFPDLKIAGAFGGVGEEKGDRITTAIINQAKPDLLLVAYGAPKQEKWIFVAINLPSEIKKKFLSFQQKWPDLPVRWTKEENLHITL